MDGLFAHLWLGKDPAGAPEPAMVEQFCRFIVDLRPKQVMITHLKEFGRDYRNYWDASHYALVFHWMSPNAGESRFPGRPSETR